MKAEHKPKAADTAAFPSIISCDSWGAEPARPGIKLIQGATRKILVHHTGMPGDNVTDVSREQAVRRAKGIQQEHMARIPPLIDSGQHFTISRGGFVLEGRHHSLETLKTGQKHVSAGHCPGRNHDSIGIENEGFYITATPTPALWDSLLDLCVTICRQYNIKAHNIFGHWDFRNTECPGAAFYRKFPQLRREVAAALGTQLGQIPERTWPDINNGNKGGPVMNVVQHLLRHAGVAVAVGTGDKWPPELTSAIQNWQQSHGLAVSTDGVMTAETWETLTPELNEHDTGDAVRAVQSILNHKGHEEVVVDGQFGPKTKNAVMDLQKLHGLPANGKVDTKTWCAVTGGVIREAFKDPVP